MQSLRITAHLATPFVVYDAFSPSLDAIIEWYWLKERGLASPNPDSDSLVQADLPLLKGDIQGEWYWCVSSPHYLLEGQQTTRMRRRWDCHDKHLDWGGKRAKFSTSEGHTKGYDLPNYLRSTPQIDWFAVGDRDEILRLLQQCTGIGKKLSQGFGQVIRWEVQEFDQDWHLWGAAGQLMRPIPVQLLTQEIPGKIDGITILRWGWRPPARLPCNQEVCAMPMYNVGSVGTNTEVRRTELHGRG